MFERVLILAFALLLAYPAFGAEPSAQGFRIVVPARDIARGEVLGDSDLAYETITGAAPYPGIVTSMDELEGMQTRRVLRAGEAIRPDDVRRPILVTRGSTVTMTFEAPGVTVTATGRAMSEGGYGETVTVQNPASFRQVSAVVIGAGQVRVAGSGIAPVGSAQIANAGR